MALSLFAGSLSLSAPVARTTMPVMKASAPVVSEWSDPIASHGTALSTNDIPFDPLGLANEENLFAYREAEIKHGRVAMLAALGWPAAEELEPIISKALGLQDELVETSGRAPSLLNGGLEEAQIPFFLLGAFSIAGWADYKGTAIQKEMKYEPGNVGFDPLSLFPTDAPTQEKYKLAELKHGRIAMVAITLYALEEAVSGTSILKETVPLFSEIERLIAEGPIQGNIDFVKDLIADTNALEADVLKEEAFYGDAFTQKIFERPTETTTVGFGQLALGAVPILAAASTSFNNK